MPGLLLTHVLTRGRRRLSIRDELALAALPTAVVLLVLMLVDLLSEQQLLFSPLAASAFLIYMDPHHQMNTIRALTLSQVGGAILGTLFSLALGTNFLAAAVAMVVTIILMIVLDLVHPPGLATAMSFALQPGRRSDLAVFVLAVGLTVGLVLVQRRLWAWLGGRSEREG